MEWIQFALFVLSVAISLANQKKTPAPPKAIIDDFDFPQMDEGTPKAVFFGECWSTGWCVIGLGNFGQTTILKPPGASVRLRNMREKNEVSSE